MRSASARVSVPVLKCSPAVHGSLSSASASRFDGRFCGRLDESFLILWRVVLGCLLTISMCCRVSAGNPLPVRLSLKLSGSLPNRYSADIQRRGSQDTFQKEVCQRVIAEINSRALWSGMCWPLEWDDQLPTSAVLQIMLFPRLPQLNDWTMNLQLVPDKGQPLLLGEFGLWQQGTIPPGNGPVGDKLHEPIVERLRIQLLESDPFRKFHTEVRRRLPVGPGISAPVPDIPVQFGLVEADHPVLLSDGVPFEFVYSPNLLDSPVRVKVRGTGKQFSLTKTGGGSVKCVVFRFQEIPPVSGTSGQVFLDVEEPTGTGLPLL